MPNQRMMGRRPPNMRGPSFGAQRQGFQQAGQFLPQANAGARNGAGAGGGLKGMLSRFLPGGGGAGSAGVPGVPGAGAAPSGGAGLQGIQNIANPASLSSMLGNVQKVLGMAQQVTPMIQQYGPLVRNLPAMMKLYSQLSKSDDTETEANEESEKQSVSEESSEKEKETETKTSDGNKKSKPKSSSLPKNLKQLTIKNKNQKHLPRRKRKSPLLLRKEHQAVQNRDYIFNIL